MIRLKSTCIWESEAGEAPPSGRGPSPRMPLHSLQPNNMDSLQSNIWTASRHKETTTSKLRVTHTSYGDTPAKFQVMHYLRTVKRDAPCSNLFITRPLSHRNTTVYKNQQLQDHKHGRRCPLCAKSTLQDPKHYRRHPATQN